MTQISPNPNFGTIFLTNNSTNGVSFNNYGTLLGNPSANTQLENLSGAILTNNSGGTIDSYGTLSNDAGAYLDNYGTQYNESSAVLDNLGGQYNEANAVLDNSGTQYIESSAYLVNYGTQYNRSGAVLDNYGAQYNETNAVLDNFGTQYNESGAYLDNSGTQYNESGATLFNSGTFINESTGSFTNSGTFNNTGFLTDDGIFDSTVGTFNNSGTLTGTGDFVGDLAISSGTIAPGTSAGGSFQVDGDFLLSGGTMNMDVNGIHGGEYDTLNVSGHASLKTGKIKISIDSNTIDHELSNHVGAQRKIVLLDAGSFSNSLSLSALTPKGNADLKYGLTKVGGALDLIVTRTHLHH